MHLVLEYTNGNVIIQIPKILLVDVCVRTLAHKQLTDGKKTGKNDCRRNAFCV
jgi:hypothetical protein